VELATASSSYGEQREKKKKKGEGRVKAFAHAVNWKLSFYGTSFGAKSATIFCCGGRRTACECGGVQPTRLPLQLRREGGDDLLEARIAAERVPDREQF
jgi:hypothetical protein